jgi:subtilase family serine protease
MKMNQTFIIIIITTAIILFSCKETPTKVIPPKVDTVVVDPPRVVIPPKLPDFKIISSSVSPQGMITPKTKCKFTFTVKNIGKGDYNGTILVGGPAPARGFNSLKAGETKKAVVEYTAYSKNATYTLTFKVDPENVIKETNESNNESQTFTIKTTF